MNKIILTSLLCLSVSFLGLSNLMTSVHISAQQSLRFPWNQNAGEWKWTQGWHASGFGDGLWALDMGTWSSDKSILSSGNGTVLTVQSCSLTTNVKIDHGNGVVFNYVHLDKNTIDSNITVGQVVQQGQYIGKLKTGSFTDGQCGIAQQNQGFGHLHLIISVGAPITIDGWTFDSNNCISKGNDVRCLNGNEMVLPRSSNSGNNACTPPTNSDWVITTNCEVTTNISTPYNVLVQGSGKLTIKDNAVLDIDFLNKKLEVQPTATVIIEPEGKIH